MPLSGIADAAGIADTAGTADTAGIADTEGIADTAGGRIPIKDCRLINVFLRDSIIWTRTSQQSGNTINHAGFNRLLFISENSWKILAHVHTDTRCIITVPSYRHREKIFLRFGLRINFATITGYPFQACQSYIKKIGI